MAILGRKNGVNLARFRYRGKEFNKSLKTEDLVHARAAMRRIEDTLHWLAIGHIAIPVSVDPGDFILSGGTLTARAREPEPQYVPTLDEAIQEYLINIGHLAESNRYTIRVHLRNLQMKLVDKVLTPIDQITNAELQRFVQARLKERSRTTASKERGSVMQFFRTTA